MRCTRFAPRAAAALLAVVVGLGVAPLSAATPPALEDIRRQTAEVRQLMSLAEVPVEVVDRESMRQHLLAGVPRIGLTTDLPAMGTLYATLGLIPASYDLRSNLVDLVVSQLDGLYDAQTKKIFLTATTLELDGRDKIILAHEYAHALQDQHFNLSLLLADAPDNADRAMAVQALVEGDALLTQLGWGRRFLTPAEKLSLDQEQPTRTAAMLAEAPLVVRTALAFPYNEGATFVHVLYNRGGNAAINQAFLEPPQSTEQILHPEKYDVREGPRQVPMPGLAGTLGGTWRAVRINMLGELGLRMLLDNFAAPNSAAAAAGWGGDVYAVLEDANGRALVAINTAWDTESDAAEFYNAFLPTVSARFGPGAVRVLDQPSLARWATPAGAVQILKTEDRVRLIFAPDAFTLALVDAQF